MKSPFSGGMMEVMRPKFVIDLNVGRLARRLRMLGYDALFINGLTDEELVRIALKEGRVLLTKDSGIMKRRVVTDGVIKAILIESDNIKDQLKQVVRALHLEPTSTPFTLCIECNEPLIPMKKEEVRNRVPLYVFETQEQYVQCPLCRRIYWRGTHWQRMMREIEDLARDRRLEMGD